MPLRLVDGIVQVMSEPARYRFPGMDPWLEAPGVWATIHDSLIIALAWDLNRQLRPHFVAVPGRRLVVEEPARSIYPDVVVHETTVAPSMRGTASAVEEPIIIHLSSEPRRETFLEIRDPQAGNRIVTIIEVLSPTNKEAGQDARDKYLQKQREVLASDVNLVEIDLLRGGLPTVALARTYWPSSEYRVVVRRATRRDEAEAYAISLRARIPRIRVPLRDPSEDVRVDLQSLLEQAYRDGSCDLLIDYTRPADPPLDAGDARWARELLDRA